MSGPKAFRGERMVSLAITLILILVVCAAALTIIGPFIGWRVNVVLSGSMEPALQTGSVILTRPIAPEQVKAGDIILFSSGPGGSFYTTHRVIGISQSPDLQFTTKGDANKDKDPSPVSSAQLAGVLVLGIPYLGYILPLIKTPLGIVMLIGLPALILIALEVNKRWIEGEG